MHSTLTNTVTGVIEAKMEARNDLRGDDIWVGEGGDGGGIAMRVPLYLVVGFAEENWIFRHTPDEPHVRLLRCKPSES